MGRCNNQRAQQRAQEMRNTPSRARFSSGPPNKRSKGKGGRGRGNAGRGGGAAKAAVVEKIAKRVETKQSTTNSSSINSNTASLTKITRRRHPLANVNISKLDELILPEESLQEVMKLLSDLKVKVVESVTRKGGGSKEETDEYDSDTQAETTQADNTLLEDEDAESYASDMEEETEDFYSEQQSRQLAGTAYAEYEDDLEEEDELLLQGGTYASQIPGDVDSTVWEGQENDEEDDEDKQKSKGEFTFTIDQLQTDPVFVHLTKRLSFSEATALRACQAIEDMTSNDTQLSDNNTSNQESQRRREGERMAFAMDWLCLHLEEDELQAGFKTNPNMASPIILMGTGRTKPIPHPSISVAPKITTDRDWKKSILVQDRILGFQQLGFQHSETYDVFKEYDLDRLEQESSSPKKAIDDDDALRHLLASLESKILEEDGLGNEALKQQQHTQADIDFAAEERESEEQALQAIYEDHFRVVKQPNTSSSSSLYRYILEVTLVEPLKEPARSEDCSLHVFVRPGYPAFETPLFLFSNPSLPPTLLRRVNVELIRHAHQNLGAPAVFDAVNYLSSELAALQLDFMKEQRSKELDAQQLRLRKEAGHKIDEEAEYDSEAKLGRRQRAKLKAAAKAFDQPEIAKKAEEERQQRQTARIERVKDEDKNIRQSMASRAIEQREKERQQEEMDAIYRSALSASLNKGHSTEAAREIATKAKSAYLKLHGLEDPDAPVESTRDARLSEDAKGKEKSSLGLDIEEDIVDGQSKEETRKAPYSTPKTVAFMERLREMYAAAAKEKVDGKAGDTQTSTKGRNKKREEDLGGYHLNPPKRMAEGEEIDGESQRFPRPVAVPVGELKRVMEDVIKIQQEQPWLVSSEARAPETATMSGQDDRNSLSQKCKDISRKLKQENERKYKAVEDWRKNQASGGNVQMDNNKKGFSPQRFNKMLSQRERLPAYAMRDHIISTIAANQVTVVAGDTGCGKTTQVPQLVLDQLIGENRGAEANIIVTQPRRISAIGVSERIAAERCEQVGETCGYSIMLERKASRKTRLLLCTTGILLRRLQVDPDIASVSHVFVDEVHERDLNTDFLLIILRELLRRRKSVKLVLMSATLNSKAFSKYFGGCAIVSIPGRAHPVKEYRLEDILQLTEYEVDEDSDYSLKDSDPKHFSKSALRKMYYPRYTSKVIHSLSVMNEKIINYELVAALLEKICEKEDEGAILVFMPGMMEITKAIDEMRKKEFFQSPSVVIYPLHSSLSTAEQTAVFDVPPEGVRKVVVSTNISETSITIEDVVYVVDCGRVKENRKDEINETPQLVETWVSRASAKQRRGRAGRVRPGIAYHLFSSHTYEHEMEEYQLPEMLRVGLEDLVLQILILDLGEPSQFLGRALNPPSELSMRNSLKLLEELGAVECNWKDSDDIELKLEEPKPRNLEGDHDPLSKRCGDMEVASELTALGFHLATLPVDPRVGKMMIYGALFGCMDPALTIAASMSARSPFVSPFDKRDEADEARKKFADDSSDHLATLNAFTKWKNIRQKKGDRAAQNFLRDNFLSRQTLFQMNDLRKEFANLLISIGFLPKTFRVIDTRKGNNNDINDAMANANVNGNNMALVKAVLCAGLYPNIIVAPRSLVGPSGGGDNKEAGEVSFQSLNKGDVYLHPSTIAFHEKRLESRYCCYHEMVKTSKTYVRDCTTVSPFALVLFGGTLVVYQEKGVATVDEWLKFRISPKSATIVKHLRAQMESMLLRKIVSPEDDVTSSPVGKALIQSISTLLQLDKAGKEERNDGAEIVRPWRGGEDQNENGSSRGGRGRGRGRSGRGGRGKGRGRG